MCIFFFSSSVVLSDINTHFHPQDPFFFSQSCGYYWTHEMAETEEAEGWTCHERFYIDGACWANSFHPAAPHRSRCFCCVEVHFLPFFFITMNTISMSITPAQSFSNKTLNYWCFKWCIHAVWFYRLFFFLNPWERLFFPPPPLLVLFIFFKHCHALLCIPITFYLMDWFYY